MSEVKQYAERDLMAMDIAGNHYCRHVDHMTREKLHSKSDIAAELGWRDMQIAKLTAEREALAAENVALKSIRNLGYINPSDLLPEAWYFQLTLEIPNLDNMTPYQAHGAAWKQSRSHILRKLEEMACTDSQAILLPELGVEFTSVPAHLENTLTCDEKNAWLSGANSIRELILNLENQLRPAPAADLAELVPDELTPKQASRSYGGEVVGYRDGWNACRAAILRKIGEAK